MIRRGNWLVLGLALLPAALVLTALDVASLSPAGWVDLLGRLSGVLGLACLLLAAVVSVRFPGFDRGFGGLTRLWRLHHRLGLAAFLLLLAHPLLMALARAPLSPRAVTEVLVPTGGGVPAWALWCGWLALVAMMVFLAPSFQLFGRPEYQRWKALHFVSGVALVAGLVHTVPLTRSMPLEVAAVVWGALGLAAVGVFVWRATVARRVLRRPYRVVENRPLADRVVQLFLEPEDERPLAHEPGQFVYLTPGDPGLAAGRDEEHPYTISSAPRGRRLEITVKALGDASRALLGVSADSLASIEGPYGDFLSRRFRSRPQLWIGGGIGITPFVSAVRSRAGETGEEESWGDTVLINCANDPSRAYFLDVLRELGAECENLSIVAHYFVRQGALDRAFVLASCPDARSRDWFVCGPPALVDVCRGLARELGVSGSRFHSEDFVFL